MTDKRFGGFWRRLFAFCIDKVILYLLSLILFLIGILALRLGGASIERIVMTGVLPRGMGLFMIAFIFTAILTDMVYFIWFHGSIGQTPGKMLFGLRVIQVSGEKMTFGVAFLRWVGYLISGLFFWLGFLWIAFDGRKQGWHDKIAATLVIHAGMEMERDRRIPQAGNSPPAIHPLTDVEDPSSAPSLPLFSQAGKTGESGIKENPPIQPHGTGSQATLTSTDSECKTESEADGQTSPRAAPLVGVAEIGQTAGETKPGKQSPE